VLLKLFERLWAQDVFIVLAAGNEGNYGATLADIIPQRQGTPGNPLLTVGGVTQDGTYWDGTTNGQGGSISISGVAIAMDAPHGSEPGYWRGRGRRSPRRRLPDSQRTSLACRPWRASSRSRARWPCA